MSDVIILFIFLTGAIAATLFFLQGAFHIVRNVRIPTRRFWNAARNFIAQTSPLSLARAAVNPILAKGASHFDAAAVLNPGAVVFDGRVHLFYRAIGMDGVSRIGYASGRDGLHFDERLPYAVYALSTANTVVESKKREEYSPELFATLYASGGSWAGVEDPRTVIIDERLYLSFAAFSDWNSLRIGVISLSLADLRAKRWRWSAPVYLSGPRDVQKNWVLFPRKIKGKFALLHGFRSGTRRRALVSYLDTLDVEPAEYLKSDYRFAGELDENVWDSRVRGFGPPPIETPYGWLAFYHANDSHESGKYKLGALLLDRNDPAKVIARSQEPILAPDMSYENEGKPGIVYATGAVVRDDTLIVYYGAGDMTICAAAAPLTEFVEALRGHTRPRMRTHTAALVPLTV